MFCQPPFRLCPNSSIQHVSLQRGGPVTVYVNSYAVCNLSKRSPAFPLNVGVKKYKKFRGSSTRCISKRSPAFRRKLGVKEYMEVSVVGDGDVRLVVKGATEPAIPPNIVSQLRAAQSKASRSFENTLANARKRPAEDSRPQKRRDLEATCTTESTARPRQVEPAALGPSIMSQLRERAAAEATADLRRDISITTVQEGQGTSLAAGTVVKWEYSMATTTSHIDKGEVIASLGRGEQMFDKGCAGMKLQEERKIFIPAHLAYGSKGRGKLVPPDADLIFVVKAVKICS